MTAPLAASSGSARGGRAIERKRQMSHSFPGPPAGPVFLATGLVRRFDSIDGGGST